MYVYPSVSTVHSLFLSPNTHSSSPVTYNGTTVYFRGLRILMAIVEDVLGRGLKSATEVIITGCSGEGVDEVLMVMLKVCVCVCVCVVSWW